MSLALAHQLYCSTVARAAFITSAAMTVTSISTTWLSKEAEWPPLPWLRKLYCSTVKRAINRGRELSEQ